MLIMVAAIVPGLLQALGLGVAGGANTAGMLCFVVRGERGWTKSIE